MHIDPYSPSGGAGFLSATARSMSVICIFNDRSEAVITKTIVIFLPKRHSTGGEWLQGAEAAVDQDGALRQMTVRLLLHWRRLQGLNLKSIALNMNRYCQIESS